MKCRSKEKGERNQEDPFVCTENKADIRKEGRESEEIGQNNSWKESLGTRNIRISTKSLQFDSANPNKSHSFIILIETWLDIVPTESTRKKLTLGQQGNRSKNFPEYMGLMRSGGSTPGSMFSVSLCSSGC